MCRIEEKVHLHPSTISATARNNGILLHTVIAVILASALPGWPPPGSTKIMITESVLGADVPPLGTPRWFRSPQPPPWMGGLAGAVQLHAGPAGGDAPAPPPKRLLTVGDRTRLGMQRFRPEGRLAASLQLPSDTTFTRHIVVITTSLPPFGKPG
jgi:hypothetical protein